MNIYAKKGDKVILTKESINNGHEHDINKCRRYLAESGVYTVHHTEVYSSSTDVYLEEIPGVYFNSVNFEDYLKGHSIAIYRPKKLTLNCYQGDRITSADQIVKLASEKKSIYYEKWGVKPASFYLGVPFRVVMNMIKYGPLFNVIKKEPEKKKMWYENQSMVIKPKHCKSENKIENLEWVPTAYSDKEFDEVNPEELYGGTDYYKSKKH